MFITARKRSYGEVMFSQVIVRLGGGRYLRSRVLSGGGVFPGWWGGWVCMSWGLLGVSGRVGTHPLPDVWDLGSCGYGRQAGGTYPTGMLSC